MAGIVDLVQATRQSWQGMEAQLGNTRFGIDDAAAAVTPISRRTLHDELVGRVRDMIIEGRLPPGSRVHEGQLGQMLGISRTPLREALKFLASEGLVALVPGKGALVRRLTAEDVREMLDVLGALEALAGRLVCRNGSDATVATILGLHAEMMTRYAEGARLEYYKLNQAIHTAIATGSGNRLLMAQHATIQAQLKRIRFVGHEGQDKWNEAVREHECINEALRQRDGERLAMLLAEHLDRTWERVRSSV
jgi:DNA-binding GntR family transcriptional regulator